MIFAGGKILPDSELNPVLGYLEEEIAQTLSGPPLEAETVLNALDALGRELDSGALDALIAQYAPPGALEELERVLAASMNGYIPGESRPIDYLYAMGELEDDRERYQVCLDTFYAVILHNQRLVRSAEDVEEGGNDTLYIGFYLPELNMADLTNCNAGSNTQWTFQEKTA